MAEPEQLPVAEARAGESWAWDALFHRYQLPLYAYIFELVRDEQASLDIIQETFINAVGHIASLRDDARLGSWLFGIAHQKCIQLWRRRDRDAIGLQALADDPQVGLSDASPRDVLVRAEQEEEFMKVLARLPAPQRSVVLLHFLEGFSLEEIAHITGTPLGTVKSRMHYAKQALRPLLEDAMP